MSGKRGAGVFVLEHSRTLVPTGTTSKGAAILTAVGLHTQLPRVVVGMVVASCSGPDFLMLEATGLLHA